MLNTGLTYPKGIDLIAINSSLQRYGGKDRW